MDPPVHNNNKKMDPPEEVVDESADTTSTTHHKPLHTIKEESMDETSTTRHEPTALAGESMEEDAAIAMAESAKEGGGVGSSEHDISLRLHRKVAEIAAKAYHRASDQSNVLSKARLADIALLKFDEIEIGQFLGKGSFSNVHEITKIAAVGESLLDESWDDIDENDNDNEGGKHSSTLKATNTTMINAMKATACPRELLSQYKREESGTMRYAIKYLKENIRASPQKYAVGTADLVVEGMFLASLAHPNIIKVRGLPEGGVKSLTTHHKSHGYFLILDRLFDTLADRIYREWQGEHLMVIKKKMFVFTDKKKKEERDSNLAVRIKVAFDISAALKFLHSKSIIYRDLKPENLGFDVRGDIKLFDLGLVKELHPNNRDRRGNWKLSMAGTPRYMAPEVGLYQPYNLSADVYSFSMLLWEILALEKPIKDFTYTRLKNEIFIDGDRPPIKKIFNKTLRNLVNTGWSQTPRYRPSMDAVYETLKKEYLRLVPTGSVTETEISHNRRRSTFVARNLNTLSVRHLMRLNTVESDAGAYISTPNLGAADPMGSKPQRHTAN